MYKNSMTVVRCSVGVTDGFKVEVKLHQGSILNNFLLAMVMGRLKSVESIHYPWIIKFADNIVIYNNSSGG